MCAARSYRWSSLRRVHRERALPARSIARPEQEGGATRFDQRRRPLGAGAEAPGGLRRRSRPAVGLCSAAPPMLGIVIPSVLAAIARIMACWGFLPSRLLLNPVDG